MENKVITFSEFWNLSQDSSVSSQEKEKLKETPITYGELAEVLDTLLANVSYLFGTHQVATELKLRETLDTLVKANVLSVESLKELLANFDKIDKIAEDGMENE